MIDRSVIGSAGYCTGSEGQTIFGSIDWVLNDDVPCGKLGKV